MTRHLTHRAGGAVADIAAIEPELIRYVQLCDGPLPQPVAIAETEAVCERLYPGDGDFPLFDFLRAAPRDQTLGIECPSLRRARSGVSAADQAKEAMAKLRRTMAEVN